MALKYAGITVEHREIELRNKPQSMLMASPKGTVPVLIIGNLILDQSLEIMHWWETSFYFKVKLFKLQPLSIGD